MISLLVILLFFVLIISFRIKRRRLYDLASLIPKPEEELYLIGMAHKFSGNAKSAMITLKKLIYDSMQNNGIIRLWLGPVLYFVLTNPVDLEMVLKTCLEKDDLHRFMRNVIGNGVIFAPVHIWRSRRKYMVPAFSPKNLERVFEILLDQSEKLAIVLESKANSEPFPMWPFLNSYTFDSVCESSMGIKTNTLNNENYMLLKSANRLFELVCERIFKWWLQPDWFYKLLPKYQEHEKCFNIVTTYMDKVIENIRIEGLIRKQRKNEEDYYKDLNIYRRPFLDLMILVSGGEKGYTNVELREEISVLIAAGMDTSAITIGNVIKLLAKYPEVQEKLYEELFQEFGESDEILVKEDLTKLKYMERVVKETLRLFPPAPIIARKILEDITLPSGRILPAGSSVLCSIYGVHRDPKYWGPSAEHFDPDRFLPERFNLAHPCRYMPFSNGPRNCVGYQYAMMTIKLALSAIICRYRIVEDKETGPIPFFKVKFDITMKAADQYQIALEKRIV